MTALGGRGEADGEGRAGPPPPCVAVKRSTKAPCSTAKAAIWVRRADKRGRMSPASKTSTGAAWGWGWCWSAVVDRDPSEWLEERETDAPVSSLRAGPVGGGAGAPRELSDGGRARLLPLPLDASAGARALAVVAPAVQRRSIAAPAILPIRSPTLPRLSVRARSADREREKEGAERPGEGCAWPLRCLLEGEGVPAGEGEGRASRVACSGADDDRPRGAPRGEGSTALPAAGAPVPLLPLPLAGLGLAVAVARVCC